MAMTVKWSVMLVLCIVQVRGDEDTSFEACLQKDSISCVQQHVYQRLRAIFNQDTINLLGGLQLTKKGSRSLDDNLVDSVDDTIMRDVDVAERQSALEDYAYRQISTFFNERSWTWQVTPAMEQVVSTARMAVSSIPQELRERITAYVVEGRGKKKILKSLIPILILAKAKLISYFGLKAAVVALIAKKALIASTVALLILLFIGIKKILAKHHHEPHYEHHSPDYYSGGYSHLDRSAASPSWSGWDSYDAHAASPSSNHLAYGSHKPNLR